MAAPATTSRTTPPGTKLDNGFSSKIAFAADADVNFWETSVQPPGIDGGDAIDITTMFNSTYRTMAARTLIQITEHTLIVSYDPNVWAQIISLVNTEGAITVHFPNSDTLDFFGYLRVFQPQTNEPGTRPTANVTITPTNWDPSNNVEQGPVYTASGS